MVEKTKARGRPRAYDPEAALDNAAELFWSRGFAAASLDELSAAMGMGRPSIYNAFGDKEALFLLALERYRDTTASAALRAMEAEASIEDALAALFREVALYTTAGRSHRGCLLMSVATSSDLPSVRRFLRTNIAATEAQVADRLADALRAGQLPADFSASQGARRAVDTMLVLGVRARLGTSRRALLQDAAAATAAVLAPQATLVSALT